MAPNATAADDATGTAGLEELDGLYCTCCQDNDCECQATHLDHPGHAPRCACCWAPQRKHGCPCGAHQLARVS